VSAKVLAVAFVAIELTERQVAMVVQLEVIIRMLSSITAVDF
jgi:hypothetical protein